MRTDNMIHLLVADLPTPAPRAGASLALWLPAAAIVAGGGFLFTMGARTDLALAGLKPTIMKLALGGLLTLGATIGALRLTRPDAPVPKAIAWLGAVVVFVACAVAIDLKSNGVDNWAARLFGKSILSCLTLIPMIALLPLAVSLAALRRGATTSPGTLGALGGLAAAGLSIMAYGLFCTEDSTLFVMTWYVLAGWIVGLTGALIGRLALRW